ncbi:MAG: RNA polymerase sigma factor, partial [Saonia sp.]
MNMETEKLLVIELSKGNESAFEKLYNTYRNNIYAYALSLLKSKVHAEEVVQEVFLAVWKKREKLDGSRSFRSFLFTMARNKSFDLLKKAANDLRLREE